MTQWSGVLILGPPPNPRPEFLPGDTHRPPFPQNICESKLWEEPDVHSPPSCAALICPLWWEPKNRSRPNTHLSFPLLPQPTPQCNGPSAAGKQEAEDRDRGEEAESRAPKVMHQSPDLKQNRAHTKGEIVWHLGLEGPDPGHKPKTGYHQVRWDAPLLRYVHHLSFATSYVVVFLSLMG